jgi:hypothetical protein
MKTSDSIDKLLPDLFKVKKTIAPLKKDASNPFFSSSYVDLNGVLDGIEPILEANNFILLQPVSGRVVETRLQHSSGQFLTSEMELILVKNDMQALGSAVSYARRYSLMSLLSLKAVDDDGNSATFEKQPQRSFNKPALVAKSAQVVDTASPNPGPVSSSNGVKVPVPTKAAAPAVATTTAAPARKPFNRPAPAKAVNAEQPVAPADDASEFD